MADPSKTTTAVLPIPTTDRVQARADLAAHGYCLVANALSAEDVEAARSRLLAVAAQQMEAGIATIDGGGANQRVWQLLNHGLEFQNLAEHPLVLDMMGPLLGSYPPFGNADLADELPQFLLSNIAANIAGPGGSPMFIHADQHFLPEPWPQNPVVASVIWMLDDFTDANGATRIVPGSHLLSTFPEPGAAERTVPAEGPAGTALVFDGRVWHGTGANTTDARRHAVLSYYSVPWFRQQENSTVSVRPDIAAAMSPTLRRLVGFDPYAYYGLIDGVPVS